MRDFWTWSFREWLVDVRRIAGGRGVRKGHDNLRGYFRLSLFPFSSVRKCWVVQKKEMGIFIGCAMSGSGGFPLASAEMYVSAMLACSFPLMVGTLASNDSG